MGAQWSGSDDTDTLRAVWTFEGGVDTSRHPQFLKNTQTSKESGVITFEELAVRGRLSRVIVGATASSTPLLLGVYQHQYLIRALAGTVQYWNGTTWANIITGLDATARITLTNFEFSGEDAIIITNGVDAPKYWNGTTSGDINTANAPKGKFIINDTVRVFIAKGDILHFCARLAVNDWTTAKNSGFIQIYTANGGDITGLTRFGGTRIIFKLDYMAELHGNNLQEFGVVDISNQVGCYSHETIQEVQGILFWLGYKQVYAFSGGLPVPIGDPVRSYVDALNWSADVRTQAFATTDGDNYLLGLGDSLLSYSPKHKMWRVNRTGQINKLGANLNNTWYTMDQNGSVYSENGLTRENMVIYSPAFTEGNPEMWKEYYELHVQLRFHSGSIEIWASPFAEGESSFMLIDTISNLTGLVSFDTPHIIPLDTFPLCHWFRLKIVVNGDAELLSVERFFNLLPADH